jgi:hypothetical protein
MVVGSGALPIRHRLFQFACGYAVPPQHAVGLLGTLPLIVLPAVLFTRVKAMYRQLSTSQLFEPVRQACVVGMPVRYQDDRYITRRYLRLSHLVLERLKPLIGIQARIYDHPAFSRIQRVHQRVAQPATGYMGPARHGDLELKNTVSYLHIHPLLPGFSTGVAH